MYARGDGVLQDYAEALRWYRKSADQGNAEAQNNLQDLVAKAPAPSQAPKQPAVAQAPSQTPHPATGAQADQILKASQPAAPAPKTAQQAPAATQAKVTNTTAQTAAEKPRSDLGTLRQLANDGNAIAQVDLGLKYDDGDGIPQDYAEAMRWYRKAADQGNAKAQNNLGLMYSKGHGVPQDDAEAVKWYRKAADQGYAIAQNNLGFMYEAGRGVPRDYAEALRWYRKAADQGNVTAQNNLQKLTAKAPCAQAEATVPTSAQEPKRLIGADLFIDLQKYVCKKVILMDGEVFGASDKGGLIKTPGTTFDIDVEGIDRESLRYFLTNCTGLPQRRPQGIPRCDVPLLVTPTGKFGAVGPELKSVKIAK
jgi:TPR repeat protein